MNSRGQRVADMGTTACLQDLVLAATKSKRPAEEEEADLVAVLTWLRFSSSRLLTWNKNYNIKPREISAAQVIR